MATSIASFVGSTNPISKSCPLPSTQYRTIQKDVQCTSASLPLWSHRDVARILSKVQVHGSITNVEIQSTCDIKLTTEITGRFRYDQISPTGCATWYVDKDLEAQLSENSHMFAEVA